MKSTLAARWIVMHGENKPTFVALVLGLLLHDGDSPVYFSYFTRKNELIVIVPDRHFATELEARNCVTALITSDMEDAQRYADERRNALSELAARPFESPDMVAAVLSGIPPEQTN